MVTGRIDQMIGKYAKVSSMNVDAGEQEALVALRKPFPQLEIPLEIRREF